MTRPDDPRILARRELVAELCQQGLDIKSVAKRLGVSKDTIDRDRAALGLPDIRVLRREERMQVVRSLLARGLTVYEIGARLGVTSRTVERDKKDLKLTRRVAGWSVREYCLACIILTEGASYNEVARTIGRDPNAVKRRFPGRGWTGRETGEFLKLWNTRQALDVVNER